MNLIPNEQKYSYWDQRKDFRDVLPFKGVNGVVAFVPYQQL